MKNIILLSLLCLSFTMNAQTPFTMLASKKDGPAQLSANSVNNPWVGAKLVYNVTGDVSNSFLLAGRAMYIAAAGDKWSLPVIADVGLSADSLDPDNGVTLGLYPWYTLSENSSLTLLAHGGLDYHIGAKDEAGYLTEFRINAGLEAAIYPKDGGLPATISAGPEYAVNTGILSGASWGLNMTGVLPIANGMGILVESITPFLKDTKTSLKIGVIINNSIK